ncbi:uncharacterized protein LOC124369259 isoform X2 [Homalodisca vitripennis]|uniref:uncharacterized protein LOC124369259 isoform X2 n=1 Tax=Homalodisca vitripennis TaxID=197043 RepID=UPI001EE9C1DB|nr:uncharacterized protein LOC124369259 isoform X2 [Homalodisca vitripennis]
MLWTFQWEKNSDAEEQCDDDDGDGPDKEKEGSPGACLDVKPSAWTLSNMYRDQPLYMNFRPRTEEAMLIDNICYTFFPLPDDQFTYVMYSSTVYRDGSNLIESDIVTDVQLGIFRAASPYCTYKDHVLGYAGCDTFVMYRCYLSNDCRSKVALYTFGLSQSCKQISISCLQKIEDIIQGNGIPEQDYVALPMRLPTKCVFDPVCTFKAEVEFFNTVGITQTEILTPVKEEPIIVVIEEEVPVPVAEEFVIVPEVVPVPFYGYDNYYSVPFGPPTNYYYYNNYYRR